MTREELERFIYEKYNVRADYPFEDDFETGVFRHGDTGRWFALAMHISARKIGRDSNEKIDVTNLKCAPEIIESMAGIESGVYRAYHMNKMHWLTVALDGTCDDGLIEWLIDISYDLTRKKKK